jgi:UDP-N-acetylglucosamine 1-carboxyvinyltransferase
MDRIRIVGGNELHGTIPISGAKNAALPLMIASLLTDETLILDNVPRLADVAQVQRILGNHGIDIMSAGKRPGDHEYQGQTLHISAAHIVDTTAPYELVSTMRASFWVIAPLLARMHQAKVSLPGGCAIGTRPVDLLIMALEKLGADIQIDGGYVIAKAPGGLTGAAIDFPKVTVSGTHVAMMAATLAKGTTVITNAACEPEIVDVADCLNKMGAKVTGAGTPRIVIEGVAKLHGARHTVLPDRIETGTYAMAVAMGGARRADGGGRHRHAEQRRHPRGAQRRGAVPGQRHHRAVPRLSDRSAGPAHGADDPRQGGVPHHRDDLREPLHACAGAGALRRAHPSRRRDRDHRRRR